MKIKEGFVLSNVAGCTLVVAIGNRAKEFSGVINVNETGAYIWKLLQRERTEEELVKAVLDEYNVDEEKAKEDVAKFVGKLKEASLLQ